MIPAKGIILAGPQKRPGSSGRILPGEICSRVEKGKGTHYWNGKRIVPKERG